MAEDAPIYDLMLLLSTTVEEDRRAKILGDVESAISGSGGSIVHNGDWGTRPMSYRIQHEHEAEYHLLQFSGPTALLETLRHNLGITDGVLRSRIIKVLPGTPAPPTPSPVAVHAAAPAPTPTPAAEPAAEAEPEPASEPAPAAEPEPAAEADAPETESAEAPPTESVE